MNDQVSRAVAEQLFYVALCVECKPLLTQPFYDETKRDEWAAAHAATGHVILTATESGRVVMVDSVLWRCAGCGHEHIGGRTPDDLCTACIAAALTRPAPKEAS